MGKYNKNDVVLGLVTGIENYGIFVTFVSNKILINTHKENHHE